jgi:POT family proton-dependent oligopeptide transporter
MKTADTAHPKGLYFLFSVEMWERFSYYGMRALLTLYMVKYLLFSTEKAGNIYGIYTGLVYLTPLIGGYLADRYLGQKKCILAGALLMMAGHFCMAIPDLPFFYTALGLLIVGNGLFKPNISTLVGKLYDDDDGKRDAGFTIFYMGINLGAFFSPLICGTLGEKVGFHWGFAAAGVGMLIGALIYMWGEKRFCAGIGDSPAAIATPTATWERQKPLTTEEKHRITVIFILMFFSIFFWMAFEQAGCSLTLFADRSTDRVIPFLNWEFPASYFQSVNPLFIILLAPLFSRMWIDLSQRGKSPSVPVKFAVGLFLVAVGFVFMVIASSIAGPAGKVSFLWLMGVYLVHTLGELCISPVGLSVVTKLAPVKFASLLMATWFLGSFFANLAAGVFSGKYDDLSAPQFFMIPVLITGIAGIVALLLAKPIKKWMHGVE